MYSTSSRAVLSWGKDHRKSARWQEADPQRVRWKEVEEDGEKCRRSFRGRW